MSENNKNPEAGGEADAASPKAVKNLYVSGFRISTLKNLKEKHGDISDSSQKGTDKYQEGFISLGPEDREKLSVEVGKIINVTRRKINKVMDDKDFVEGPVPLRIVEGMNDVVAITGTPRGKLGLEPFKVKVEKKVGDKVNIVREGDDFYLEKTFDGKKIKEGTDEYDREMMEYGNKVKGRSKDVKVEKKDSFFQKWWKRFKGVFRKGA